MKVRLQRKLVYLEQLIVDLATTQLSFVKADSEKHEVFKIPLAGFYDLVDDQLVALMTDELGNLTIIANYKWLPFNSVTNLEYRKNGSTAHIYITTNEKSFEIEYDTSSMIPATTLWYSEDYEDVDFGLWLAGVFNSKEKAQAIRESWSKAQ